MKIDQLESEVAAPTRVANRVYEWARASALKLNASKTKAMICGYRAFVDSIPHDLPRIEVSGMPVSYVETAENLGVSIDSKFPSKPQAEAVAKKVNRALYSLNFCHHFTTLELRKRLVSALVLSHLDHRLSVFYANVYCVCIFIFVYLKYF